MAVRQKVSSRQSSHAAPRYRRTVALLAQGSGHYLPTDPSLGSGNAFACCHGRKVNLINGKTKSTTCHCRMLYVVYTQSKQRIQREQCPRRGSERARGARMPSSRFRSSRFCCARHGGVFGFSSPHDRKQPPTRGFFVGAEES